MEMLTNKTPSAKYLGKAGTASRNTWGASISAAMVIAAGSVTREPSRGTAAKPSHTAAT